MILYCRYDTTGFHGIRVVTQNKISLLHSDDIHK